ncbi:MAG: 6-phosphogluconolactonase [Firmicutes bacterium]|nr:6-phosphogluconolactonase [Bacillota bacterium]
MNLRVYDTPEEASFETAAAVAGAIRENPGRLFCFAAGDTPLAMLRGLTALQAGGKVNLNLAYYAGLDECVGLGYGDKGSCAQVMRDTFYGPAGIAPERVHIFDGLNPSPEAECRAMEKWIADRDGIFLTVLGVGMNGHIGFNEPNFPQTRGCVVVPLDATTQTVSQKYFDRPRTLEQGVTIGLPTLAAAEHVYVMAFGAKKAEIIQKAFFRGAAPKVPASQLAGHPGLTLVLDKEAAGR